MATFPLASTCPPPRLMQRSFWSRNKLKSWHQVMLISEELAAGNCRLAQLLLVRFSKKNHLEMLKEFTKHSGHGDLCPHSSGSPWKKPLKARNFFFGWNQQSIKFPIPKLQISKSISFETRANSNEKSYPCWTGFFAHTVFWSTLRCGQNPPYCSGRCGVAAGGQRWEDF